MLNFKNRKLNYKFYIIVCVIGLIFIVSNAIFCFISSYLGHFHNIKIKLPNLEIFFNILFYIFFIGSPLFESLVWLGIWNKSKNMKYLYFFSISGIFTIFCIIISLINSQFTNILSNTLFALMVLRYNYSQLKTLILGGTVNGYLEPILELAGQSVQGIQDGFSERPYPFGKIDLQKSEIDAFVLKMKKLSIAPLSFIEKDRAVLVFSKSLWLDLVILNLDKRTYVEFDNQGNISVQITREAYEKYKEQLTFDELCRSLGFVVIKFLKLYREGKTKEILKMLKKVAV
jgi:hypothetical protein